MGLDMYVFYTNRTNHTSDELVKIDNIKHLNPKTPEAQPFLPLREYTSLKDVFTIFHEGAYWRKANTIHAWFVDNIQKGVDDCSIYELTREDLENLKNVCVESIKTKTPSVLKPRGGFFFGTLDIDDWYWADLKRTVEQVDKMLAMDWNARRFFYQSSW